MRRAPEPQDQFEQWELDAIQSEARVFCGQHQFRWSDADDLAGVGAIAWLGQRRRHDPSRASRLTYLKRVVRHAFIDHLRAEGTKSRAPARGALSLELHTEDGFAFGESFTDGGAWENSHETQEAIRRAMQRLSRRQRLQLSGILGGYAMKDLARGLGVHRDTLNADMQRIRAIFREEGLD